MNWKKIGRTLLNLAGIVIFAYILYRGGFQALSRVAQGRPVFLLGTLLAIGGITLLGSLRWRLLVSALSQRPPLPVRQIYHYNILGRAISLFAPRGVGDFAGRPLALRAEGGSTFGVAVYSTFLDRLFDYFLLAFVIFPALLYVAGVVSLAFGAGITFSLVAIVLIGVGTRFGLLFQWLNRAIQKLAGVGQRVPLMENLFTQDRLDRINQLENISVPNRIAGRAFLYTIAQYMLIILRSYLIGHALGIELPYLLLMFASPIAQLAQLLAFTPGALGFRELGWYSVLQAGGIPTDDLLTFLVGHRAYIYVCIVVLALGSQGIRWLRPTRTPAFVPGVETKRQET